MEMVRFCPMADCFSSLLALAASHEPKYFNRYMLLSQWDSTNEHKTDLVGIFDSCFKWSVLLH